MSEIYTTVSITGAEIANALADLDYEDILDVFCGIDERVADSVFTDMAYELFAERKFHSE